MFSWETNYSFIGNWIMRLENVQYIDWSGDSINLWPEKFKKRNREKELLLVIEIFRNEKYATGNCLNLCPVCVWLVVIIQFDTTLILLQYILLSSGKGKKITFSSTHYWQNKKWTQGIVRHLKCKIKLIIL